MKAKIEVYIREDQMRQRIGLLVALRFLKKKLSEGKAQEASRKLDELISHKQSELDRMMGFAREDEEC